MRKILIFGGTTEGRLLAEWCGSNGKAADISVTTGYGAELLTKSSMINVLTGKLGCPEMKALITAEKYIAVVDATHPYAAEATANIRKACEETGVDYYRLLRGRSELYGKCAGNMAEMIRLLNESDAVVLSTLGSKELPELSKVHGHGRRMWLRLLPADDIEEYCVSLGFDSKHIILGKGPFTVDDNIRDIRQSGAKILVTKESGKTGGYPEKIAAAKKMNIGTITLTRPDEDGYSFEEITEMIGKIL